MLEKIKEENSQDEQRIEFHLSAKDTQSLEKYLKESKNLGQMTLGIANEMNVENIMTSCEIKGREDMKILYGLEVNMTQENNNLIALNEKHLSLKEATYVSFEMICEGGDTPASQLLELVGVKIRKGQILATFHKFINPRYDLPERFFSRNWLDIKEIKNGDPLKKVLREFQEFSKDAILISFDLLEKVEILKKIYAGQKITFSPSYIDTFELINVLRLGLNRLDFQFLKEEYTENYFPIEDAFSAMKMKDPLTTAEANAYLFLHFYEEIKNTVFYHDELNSLIPPLETKQVFKTLVYAKEKEGLQHLYHLLTFAGKNQQTIPEKEIKKYRNQLLVGSSFSKGEIAQSLEKRTVLPLGTEYFYDFLEISSSEKIELTEKIVAFGEKEKIPVIATGNFKEEEKILSTGEMLEKFAFLGDKKAREIVIDYPHILADEIADFWPKNFHMALPLGKNANHKITFLAYEKAFELYGGPQLPQKVKQRLEQELAAIIKYNFSESYLILHELFAHFPNENIGSRGSCSASFVSFLLGTTHINPLPTHDYCKNCGYSNFQKETLKNCPHCHKKLIKEGFNLPFASFSGLHGNKIPNFIFNVSVSTMKKIPDILVEQLGEQHIFNPQIKTKTNQGTSAKNQFFIIPQDMEVSQFAPVSDASHSSSLKMLQFSAENLENQLMSFQIFTHETIALVNFLEEISGLRMKDIPYNDQKTLELFSSTEILEVSPAEIYFPLGTLGIPEFAQKNILEMLKVFVPESFSDLVKISGLAHGKGLKDSLELFIKDQIKEEELVTCPEDILDYLKNYHIDFKTAFTISEMIRKGQWKHFKDKNHFISLMENAGVPLNYLASLDKINYLFPKGHLIEYTRLSYVIAYFKVHYPLYFYAGVMTHYLNDLNFNLILSSSSAVKDQIENLLSLGENISFKETRELQALLLVNEMYARGFSFAPVSEKSHAEHFILQGEKLLIPQRIMWH